MNGAPAVRPSLVQSCYNVGEHVPQHDRELVSTARKSSCLRAALASARLRVEPDVAADVVNMPVELTPTTPGALVEQPAIVSTSTASTKKKASLTMVISHYLKLRLSSPCGWSSEAELAPPLISAHLQKAKSFYTQATTFVGSYCSSPAARLARRPA